MDIVRRFSLNLWGQHLEVDYFCWTRMPGGSNDELGIEALRVNPETGKAESYISAYEGIVAQDFSPEITVPEFIENVQKSKNLAEQNRKKFSEVDLGVGANYG